MFPELPIPGQTPLNDISGLRDKRIQTTSQLNNAEAENIRKAAMKYLITKPSKRSARFDFNWLMRLHVEMFGDVWSWAGTLRKHETNIGTHPNLIEIDLHNMLEDLRVWNSTQMPLIEQSTRLHHCAVKIHPFPNGNGRWSRMLGNIWLKLHDVQPVVWPETTIGTASTIRVEYLNAVRAADKGDYSLLLSLHERFAT